MTSLQLRASPNNVGTVPFYGIRSGPYPASSSKKDSFSSEMGPSLLSEKLANEYQKIEVLEQRIKELAKIDGVPEELFASELLCLKNARQIIAGFMEQCQGLMSQIVRNIG